jgi:hypothetical protein
MRSRGSDPQGTAKREFPDRILVADVAHPDRREVELEIVSDEYDWENLPTAVYLRDGYPAG